ILPRPLLVGHESNAIGPIAIIKPMNRRPRNSFRVGTCKTGGKLNVNKQISVSRALQRYVKDAPLLDLVALRTFPSDIRLFIGGQGSNWREWQANTVDTQL